MFPKFLFPLIWILMSGITLSAQHEDALSFEVELIEPQLFNSHSGIEKIIEGDDGHLWITSRSGLQCFDGKRILNYIYEEDKNEFELSDEKVAYKYSALIDSTYLWFSNYHEFEVLCFNIKTRAFEQRVFSGDMPKNVIVSGDGKKGFALKNEKGLQSIVLAELRNKAQSSMKLDLNARVRDYIYHNGNHWLKCDDIGWKVIDAQGQLIIEEGIFPHAIYTYDGRLFLTKDRKFYELEIKNREVIQTHLLDFPEGFAKYSSVLPQGDQFWVIDDARNIILFDPVKNTIENYTNAVNEITNESAPQALRNSFSTFQKLSNGDLLMTNGYSILKLSPVSSSEEKFLEAIPYNQDICSMRGMVEDSEGNIYASFYTGISVINNNGTYSKFKNTHEVEKLKNATFSLSLRDDKLIWNHNVFDIENGQEDDFLFDGYGSHVNHLMDNDTLWVFHWLSTLWGKYTIPDNDFQVVKESLHGYKVSGSDMVLDKTGEYVYLSTDFPAIYRFTKQGNIVDSLLISELGMDRRYNLMYDMEIEGDSLWFGTTQGLVLYNLSNEKYKVISSPFVNDDGRQSNRSIFSLLPDEQGNFYLGSNAGLLYYDRGKDEILLLDEKHPLAKKEFNRGSTLRSKKGKYYMGSINGLYSFYPDELQFGSTVQKPSKPFITQLAVRNENDKKNRSYSSYLNDDFSITLKPTDNYLRIDFSSPNNTTDNVYSYRFREIDDTWRSSTPNEFFEFYSLPIGTYFLDIQSKADNTSSSGVFASVKIKKLQVWYKRWYVISMFVLAVILLALLLIRARYRRKLNRQKEMETLRNKISSDLHDDVGSILTGLAMQSEMMSFGIDSNQKESLEEMAAMSRDAMERMRDTVWAIDSGKDTFKDLVARIHSFAESNLAKKNIEYRLDTTKVKEEIMISPELRQNVYLIAKEAITNVLKHSNATRVGIDLKINDGAIELIVSDNGVVDKTMEDIKAASGLGTNNMHRRAKQIGGELELKIDDGFLVELQAPFKK